MGFQKFFLIWIAGTILEGWEAELEMASYFLRMCLKFETRGVFVYGENLIKAI